MTRTILRLFAPGALLLAFTLSACGGCDDTATATPGTLFDSEPCTADQECIGECSTDGLCTGGGTTGFDGETCSADDECRGECSEAGVCEGAGTGEIGTECTSDDDCLGTCDTSTGTCGEAPALNNSTANNSSNLTANNPTGLDLCDGRPCACDDGIDNDGDGTVDGFDAECTGPYDDDEGTFATGIPGDNIDFCQDCFFDGNSGSGDDSCEYHTDCLYGREPPGAGMAGCFNCEVSQQCFDFCRPRTPNGCDCFGCCEVETDSGEKVLVFLQEQCTLDDIDNEELCPRCVQTAECVNECGRCELCPGKTIEDLPEDCSTTDPDPDSDAGTTDGGTDGGTTDDPGYTCEDGETVCKESGDCPYGFYCQQGCCLEVIL